MVVAKDVGVGKGSHVEEAWWITPPQALAVCRAWYGTAPKVVAAAWETATAVGTKRKRSRKGRMKELRDRALGGERARVNLKAGWWLVEGWESGWVVAVRDELGMEGDWDGMAGVESETVEMAAGEGLGMSRHVKRGEGEAGGGVGAAKSVWYCQWVRNGL